VEPVCVPEPPQPTSSSNSNIARQRLMGRLSMLLPHPTIAKATSRLPGLNEESRLSLFISASNLPAVLLTWNRMGHPHADPANEIPRLYNRGNGLGLFGGDSRLVVCCLPG